ncbi:MAG TPA: hypothetical protein VJ793_25565 [Anaerolineae bacterium]|nr:hypothetical protein [Anaerolineae bacterium]
MNIKVARQFVLPIGIGLAVAWLVVAGLSTAQAQSTASQVPLAAAAVNRPQDPVVVKGANFSAFSGTLLDDLVLHAYRSGNWTAIPFQIDEVNITGTYVISDGGLLDPNDELVFMAGDAGDSVSTAIWPADTQSRLYSRYAITVTDPLSVGGQAWVYLYRSTTLTPSSARYITWTESAQTATAISYTAAFSPAAFVGLSDLFINGRSADILDRQKFRAQIFFLTLNEETLRTFVPATVTLPAVGPIRAAASDGGSRTAFYGSRIDFDVTLDLSILGGFLPDFIRTSFDWISPTISGITTYYDSNTAGGVTIDGVTDAVPTTPPNDWFQVNGGAGGPGGLVAAIPNVDTSGGALSNYYTDDSTCDPGDTGDHQCYGDAGLRIDGPGPVISFTLVAYVLPPGTTANVGETYFERADNPLTAAVAEQCFTPSSSGCLRIYLPLVVKNFAGAP